MISLHDQGRGGVRPYSRTELSSSCLVRKLESEQLERFGRSLRTNRAAISRYLPAVYQTFWIMERLSFETRGQGCFGLHERKFYQFARIQTPILGRETTPVQHATPCTVVR